MALRNLLFRSFRKLHVLPYVNTVEQIVYAKRKVNIPVINELGYSNLFLEPNWLYTFVNELITVENVGFIDVGANIGQTLIAVKAITPSVHYIGFDPSVACCYYLKSLIDANRFNDCRVYNIALSDKPKEAFLETNVNADPTGSMVTNLRPKFYTQREAVVALDYDRLPIDTTIHCVKIDVEGGELEALLGMQNLISRDQPFIICEILDSFVDDVLTFTQERANQVCSLLHKHGYAIVQLVQNAQADRIINFEEIDSVNIRQWTAESPLRNDYVFYPLQKRDEILGVLNRLCNQQEHADFGL